MLVIGNGRLLTRGRLVPYIDDGAVAVDNEHIIEVGQTADILKKYGDAEFIDAKRGVIMPGLINTHTHIYSALARGLAMPDYNPTCFYEILDGMWWRLDRHLSIEGCRMSAYATMAECVKNGVTTIFDHHASFFQPCGSLAAIAEVSRKVGLRSCLCYETSERDGMEKCEEAIRENVDFIEYCEAHPSAYLKAMFGMHASFTLSEDTMRECVRANAGRVGFHIHVSEGLDDVYDAMHKYQKRPVQRLYDLGILGEKTILGHCIHVTASEMELIKSTNTNVVNNPASNMGNAVGCSPIIEMYRRGISLGLGTDAYTNDMLESAKTALAIQRHCSGDPTAAWNEVTSMLIEGNAHIAGNCFGERLGVLEAGAAADIVVMDYNPYTRFDENTGNGHMLFGMSGRDCTTTIVGGRVLMRDRRLTTIDEELVYGEIRSAAEALWKSV